MIRRLFLPILLVFLPFWGSAQSFPVQAQAVSMHSHSDEIIFWENKGQWPPQVRYAAEISAGMVFVEDGGLTLNLIRPDDASRHHDWLAAGAPDEYGSHDSLHYYGVRIRFADGQTPSFEATEPLAHQRHYFIGNDSRRWAAQVQGYRRLRLNEVWKGIDFVLTSRNGNLKYDIAGEREADMSVPALRYEGARPEINAAGRLTVHTPLGDYEESEPLYESMLPSGARQSFTGRFQVQDQTVKFLKDNRDELSEGLWISAKYNPVTIDPELIFGTWSRSAVENYGACATYARNGGTYAAGVAKSIGYPTTLGAYSVSFAGGPVDVVITKFSADGTAQEWSTYLGGTNLKEMPMAMKENAQGQLWVTGFTESLDFPTTAGAFQTTNGGQSDIFLCRLSANGSQLLASTYVGGNRKDGDCEVNVFDSGERMSLILDALSRPIVSGSSNSNNFPTTPGCYNPFYSGEVDAVFFRAAPDGTSLDWCTYLGGIGNDFGYCIQQNNAGEIVACGGTTSFDFPATAGAFQSTLAGNFDAYVAKLSVDGSSLLAASFFGTPTYDQALMLALDDDDEVYVTGQTMSYTFPIIGNAYQNQKGKNFFQKWSADLSQVLISTVVGPPKDYPDVTPTAFMVDSCGKIYYAGWACRIRYWLKLMPVTADAFQDTTDPKNFYIATFWPDYDHLLYGTFFGGTNSQDHSHARQNHFTPTGVLHQCLCTGCRLTLVASPGNPANPGVGVSTLIHMSEFDDMPVTPGAFGDFNRSHTCNLYAFKFDLDFWDYEADYDIMPGDRLCAGETFTFVDRSTAGHFYDWNFGDGTPHASGDSVTHTYAQAGTYFVTLTVTDSIKCRSIKRVVKEVIVLIRPYVNAGPDKVVCEGGHIELQGIGSGAYHWEPAAWVEVNGIANPMVNPPDTMDYVLTMTHVNGCTASDTVRVEVFPVDAQFGYSPPFPERDLPVQFMDQSLNAITWNWSFGDGNFSTDLNPVHTFAQDGTYPVMLVISSLGECQDTMIREVIVDTKSRLFVPNAFTPNGDGLNDEFLISGYLLTEYELMVFDRNGMLVFTSASLNDSWNGVYQNQPAQEGTYVYRIRATSEKGLPFSKEGSVMLIR